MTLEDLGWDATWASELEQLDDNLIPARVAAQHRGAYVLWTDLGELRAQTTGRLAYDAVVEGGLPAVGDWVAAEARPDEGAGTIRMLLPRRTGFSRKESWRAATEQVLAANVDTALLLVGLDQEPNLRRLERYLTTAWESGAVPVVVLTKSDLCRNLPEAVVAVESVAFGVPVHPVSNVTGEGLDAIEKQLQPGRTAVLLGQSGVGKSTLLNRLAGTDLMRTAELGAEGKGRHTTTHRELFALPSGALVIDTPGLRELALWDGDVEAAFEDVEALAAECRFSDCAHTREPGCAVLAAVDEGRLPLDRLRSWRKLQRELASIAARKDRRLHAELKRRWRQQTHAKRRSAW